MDTSNKQSPPAYQQKTYKRQQIKCANANNLSLSLLSTPTNKAYQHQQTKPTNTNKQSLPTSKAKSTNTNKAYQHQKQSLPTPTAKPTNTNNKTYKHQQTKPTSTNKESFQHQQTKLTNTDKQSRQTPTKADQHLQPKLAPIISDIELQFSLDLGQTWSLLLPACLPSNLHCSNYYADSHYTSDLHAGWNRITVLLPERAR